jgi:8-oxo-dGTP pyrophosphatase MutT (NUDIX family)
MRVEVRALIVDDGRVAVLAWSRHGRRRLSLPGGGVERWESTADALVREVREELGVDIAPGRFVCAFETVSRFKVHDLNLVFEASLVDPADVGRLEFVDPADLPVPVYPPVVDRIAPALSGADGQQPWLGNVWDDTLYDGSPT